MRALTVPVVLSSVVLGSWLPAAAAQQTFAGAQTMQMAAPDTQGQAGLDQAGTPGVIPQPSPANPGVVLGVSLGELYTDNLKLAARGGPRQSSWVTQVQPFVRAAWGAPRLSGWLDYTLTGYHYSGSSTSNQVAQDLDAQGTLTAISQHLFVNGAASYRRAIINDQAPGGSGTFFLDHNQANIATALLSPYWAQNLGAVGDMTLRYTVGRVVYNRKGIPDENNLTLSGIPNLTSHGVAFNLVSPVGQAWGWSAAYSQQRISYSARPSLTFATAKVGISRQVSISTQLVADVGKEDKYLPDGTIDHLGANFWDVGVDWSSTRDRFMLRAGHRFFGRSAELSWTHHAALLQTTVGYTEQPTNLDQQLLRQGMGATIPSTGGFTGLPSLTNRQIYLMKRASASATYEMPHSHLTLTLYDETRDYLLLQGQREKVANAGLAWRFDLGPNTTFTPTVGWQRQQFRNDQVNYSRYGQLALVHQFRSKDFASLQYRNDSRNAYAGVPGVSGLPGSSGTHGYRVNVVYFQWTHLF